MLINIKRASFLFIVFPFLLIFILLFFGIKIDSFSLFGVKISQFYIKLDKKLILRVDNIEYKYIESEVEDSVEASKNDLTILPKVLRLFEEIDIKNISINDNNFKIYIKDGKIELENKFLSVDARISGNYNQIFLDIENLYLKDYKVRASGRAKLDYFDSELNYVGKVYYENLELTSNISFKNDLMKFFINSETFENLYFLKNSLELPEVAESWMYDNVKGEMKLEGFYGEFNLQNYTLDINSLEGNATIKNAEIEFQKGIDKIHSKDLKIKFKNNSLKIDLEDAFFKNKELNNSFVKINNIADSENGEVLINIETKSALDKDIIKILSSYGVDIPLEQTKGKTEAKVLLTIPYSSEKMMKTKGEFIIEPSTIAIGNFVFNSKKAELFLNDSELNIKKANFIFQDMIEANGDIKFDLSTLKANGNLDIRKVFLASGNDSIIELKNQKSKINMDFKNNTSISLDDLDIDISYDTKLNIYIKDLKKIYPHSKLLQTNSIKDGEIYLIIYDENKINLYATVSGLELPIKKDGNFISSFDIYGDITNNIVSLSTLDGSLKLKVDDKTNISLDKYEVIIVNSEEEKESELPKNLRVELTNSIIDLFGTKIRLKDADVSFDEKSDIYFNANARIPKKVPVILKKENKEIKYLDLTGNYKNKKVKLETKDGDLKVRIDGNNYTLFTKDYEIYYNLPKDENKTKKATSNEDIKLNLSGENTTVVLNNEHKLKASKYNANITENRKFIYIESDKTKFTYSEDNKNYFDIYLSKASSKFVNNLSNKEALEGGYLDFYANGTMKNLKGQLFIKDTKVKELSTINNILFFIQTSPGLINPLFAIPAVLNLDDIGHYEIEKGSIKLLYSDNMNILYLNEINLIGNGMDLEGNAYINLNNNDINADLNLIFMKTYSNVVNVLPVVNYILLGDDRRVDSRIKVSGDLKDPKIESNLLGDSLNAPVNILKRTINAPVDIFNNFIKNNDKKE
ncbi:AsmA-like C-terminal domain-containing protein [Arcobacter porcinus]|uniref:AsmA family protein (DUF3971 domain) n=1 Tax=Arcobacter porcinus TaxID=1935204 RepID=A0A5C2HHB3_9BACT|nr:AsmA-like C-terminal domain-containing protein [Arcobacter porcinus]QEP40472.1 AsmA family protein (DUF3971 domain) [Arcobacter porcinus]